MLLTHLSYCSGRIQGPGLWQYPSGSLPHPEQLQNSPPTLHLLGNNLQNESAPDNSFLECFPAHTYLRYPESSSCIHSGNSPRPLSASGYGQRQAGERLPSPAPRSPGRSANARASPGAPQSGPVPRRCPNRLLSVVLGHRQRF